MCVIVSVINLLLHSGFSVFFFENVLSMYANTPLMMYIFIIIYIYLI